MGASVTHTWRENTGMYMRGTGVDMRLCLVFKDCESEESGEAPRLRARHRLLAREEIGDREPHHVKAAEPREQSIRVVLILDAGLAELVIEIAKLRVVKHIVRLLEEHEGRVGLLLAAGDRLVRVHLRNTRTGAWVNTWAKTRACGMWG